MRFHQIKTFYNPLQACESHADKNYSKSPLKPKKLIQFLKDNQLIKYFDIHSAFPALTKNDLLTAHTVEYVDNFLEGKGNCESNGLKWSKEFSEAVLMNNASFYTAIRNSVVNPQEISFSPSSGFHHARPNRGSAFCTFSGQVISSLKIWEEFKMSGCYLDLDGHFGNSIEDTRSFTPNLNHAIPPGFNFNPKLYDAEYFGEVENFIGKTLEPALLAGKIHYIVWCHGADSHKEDQLGDQCSTEWWMKCAEYFWQWVREMDAKLGRNLPVSCALFGGYRDDDFNSVLSLHTGDLMSCVKNCLEIDVDYQVVVKPRKR